MKHANWPRGLTPSRILVLGFAIVILLGSFLLMLPIASQTGQSLPFTDALFTATSAVCVTGLVVVNTPQAFNLFGQIVIICLIQVGGLGFMTVATFISVYAGKKIGLRERLILQTSLNVSGLEGLIRLTRNVVMLTLTIEAVFATVLAIRFSYDMPASRAVYFGVFHAISAFCNAGFDLFGNSLLNYTADVTVNVAVMLLILLGGLGFVVLVDLLRLRKGHRLALHSKIVLTMTAILLVVGAIGYYALEYTNPGTLQDLSTRGKILASLFASVTARTAGFGSVDYGKMTVPGLMWTDVLMFIGANPGSTGGGIKTVTAFIIMLFIWTVASGREQTTAYHRRIPALMIYRAMVIFVLSSLLVMGATMLLTITEGKELHRLLFETTSAFATVGLSTNLTPELSVAGRYIIILLMFIGRLGPLTIALALAERRPEKENVKYPEGSLYIG